MAAVAGHTLFIVALVLLQSLLLRLTCVLWVGRWARGCGDGAAERASRLGAGIPQA